MELEGGGAEDEEEEVKLGPEGMGSKSVEKSSKSSNPAPMGETVEEGGAAAFWVDDPPGMS